jgi:hypothetical protein
MPTIHCYCFAESDGDTEAAAIQVCTTLIHQYLPSLSRPHAHNMIIWCNSVYVVY